MNTAPSESSIRMFLVRLSRKLMGYPLNKKEKDRIERIKRRAHHLQNQLDKMPMNYDMSYTSAELSALCLFLATGKSTKQIKTAISQMVSHGGIVSAPGPKGIVYSLYKASARVPRKPSKGIPAGPILVGRGTRWGASLV